MCSDNVNTHPKGPKQEWRSVEYYHSRLVVVVSISRWVLGNTLLLYEISVNVGSLFIRRKCLAVQNSGKSCRLKTSLPRNNKTARCMYVVNCWLHESCSSCAPNFSVGSKKDFSDYKDSYQWVSQSGFINWRVSSTTNCVLEGRDLFNCRYSHFPQKE